MSIYYRPENAVLGDVIPFFDVDGKFKPFYLRNFRHNRDAEHQDSWVMLTTEDHIHFTEHDTKIAGGTGSVILVDGVYHLFYCTFPVNPDRNYINHAISTDMDVWTEIVEDRFRSDDHIYAAQHWRDPFVFWVEEEQCWWMILAAQKEGPTTRRACVGLCKSKDLHKWEYCEPFYAPMNAQCAFECPDLFQIGDWWYLVFSSYADRFQTLYRRSKSLNGPWETPEIDTFDTRAFYAAKTGSDGNKRYIYGWNPTRELNDHHFNPKEYPGLDCNEWDWGGNLIVHELYQDQDGWLWVKPVEEIQEEVGQKEELCMEPLTGEWKVEGNQAAVETPYGYSALLLNSIAETEKASRLSFDVDVKAGTSQVGVAIRVDQEFSVGYYINIDFDRERMEFKTAVRMTERGGQMFPYEVEMERPLPKTLLTGQDVSFHMDIFVDDTILEAYLDNKVVLGTRMFDVKGGNFGLYASDGDAAFRNISVFSQK